MKGQVPKGNVGEGEGAKSQCGAPGERWRPASRGSDSQPGSPREALQGDGSVEQDGWKQGAPMGVWRPHKKQSGPPLGCWQCAWEIGEA